MDKRAFVQRSFAAIAESYDCANTLLSLGADLWWRKEAVKALSPPAGWVVLDCCAGTLRLSRALAKGKPGVRVVAVDFSLAMLAKGKKGLNQVSISIVGGDAERLPFREGTFDGAIVGFGIRNLAQPEVGVAELYRVIKKGGRIVILEFGRPTFPVFKEIYRWYLARFIPWAGGLLSGEVEVYRYLYRSIISFPEPQVVMAAMRGAGFTEVRCRPLIGGIVHIYAGQKAPAR